jgi:phospholipid/cholesterol/gamma-HCH transport system substrate-binding protein
MVFQSNEKKAFIGIFISVVVFMAITFYIGKKNYWFSNMLHFKTKTDNASGIREGADINLRGLKVGSVKSLRVNEEDFIEIEFVIYEEMAKKLTKGSKALLSRTFIIGEKRIDLVLSRDSRELLTEGSFIESFHAKEITDLLDTSKLTPFVERMDKTLINVNSAAMAIDKSLAKVQRDLLDNKLVKTALEDTKSMIRPFKNKGQTVEELIVSASELAKEIGKNPGLTKDVAKTLQEAIITLKAIQKTWMLKSHVEELKKQEK